MATLVWELRLGHLLLPGIDGPNVDAPRPERVIFVAAHAPSMENPNTAQATTAAHALPRNVMISSTGPLGRLHLLVPAPHVAVQERADIRPFCDDGHALSRRAPLLATSPQSLPQDAVHLHALTGMHAIPG